MIPRPGLKSALLLIVVVVVGPLLGCSSSRIKDTLPDQRLVYKKQREAAESLEIPPDLTAGAYNDSLDIPDVGASTTYSEYSGGRARRQQVASSGDVLPDIPNVDLKRRGSDRWIEVQASPQQVWPKVIAFWRQQGLLLVEQNPTLGLMRTDWLENRAEIRRDFVTRMISKVADGLYSTPTRDQYTLRVEKGVKPGTTDIHITHRGMAEKLVPVGMGTENRAVWEPSGSDTEKEAEMLRQLMVFLGAPVQRAAAAEAAGSTGESPVSRLVSEAGGQAILIPEEYRSAWRRTGLALDRAGFAVEDRDQTKGVYYVRYGGHEGPRGPGPDGGPRGEKKRGIMSRMAFWHKEDSDKVRKYQIKVTGNGTESRVHVLDTQGNPDHSPNAERILGLLQEQIR